MHDSDTSLAEWCDIPRALALLSRLPVPVIDGSRGARGAWAWPLAGPVVAAPAALTAVVALAVGLTAAVAAALALAALVLACGALHEDGLADCADGIWGGTDPAARLRIMKDSQIGTYGALALGLSALIRWAALTQLLEAGPGAGVTALLAAAALSRAAMAGVAATLPHARPDGLARHVGRVPRATAQLGVGVAAGAALLLVGWTALPAITATALAAWAVARRARARLGGQTGDVLGAAQQIAEIAALLVLAALA